MLSITHNERALVGAPPPRPGAIGHGDGLGHHGEIIQGVHGCRRWGVRRVLVTMPCRMFRSSARFVVADGQPLTIEPAWKVKALTAARLTVDELGHPQCGGRLEIASETPIGWGFGSSTSDVVAAIRAVASALHVRLRGADVARLAVAAEVASDSTMFDDRAVVFAQRHGAVVEDLGGAIPALVVLGINTDPTGRGVDTLSHPPADYSWLEIEEFRPLLGLLRRAIRDQDPRLIGRVATASARINERFLPKPRFAELQQIADRHHAVGVQVAHSGTVVGLMFDATDRRVEDDVARAGRDVLALGFSETWRFGTAEL